MKCSYCGANIPEDELYCPECGSEVQIVPDYNPLEDVLAKQVKGSIDGSTRPLDLYDDRDRQSQVGKSKREAEERRRQQVARKKALAKKKRIRALVILGILCVVAGIISVLIYQSSYSALIRRGDSALGQNDYVTADENYNRALSKDVTRPEAYTGLANVFAEQNDLDHAEDVFLDAITLQTNNAELYKACIAFYIKTEQLPKIPLLIDNCDDDAVLKELNEYVCEMPEFSLEEGTYEEVQEVSIDSDEQAVYYTTDGSDPTSASTKYTEPIQLAEGETVVKAISVNSNDIPSMITTITYTIELPVADAPAVSPSTGQHDSGTEITIQVPDGYSAYYTMDGSDPTSGSSKYFEPIYMPENTTTVFKAVLINSSGKATQITTRTYITE